MSTITIIESSGNFTLILESHNTRASLVSYCYTYRCYIATTFTTINSNYICMQALQKVIKTFKNHKHSQISYSANFEGEKFWRIHLQPPKNLPSKCIITLCHTASSVMFNCQNFTIQMHLQASSTKNSMLYSSLDQFVTKITRLLCKTFLCIIDCQEPLYRAIPLPKHPWMSDKPQKQHHKRGLMNCCFTYLDCSFIGDWYVCNYVTCYDKM